MSETLTSGPQFASQCGYLEIYTIFLTNKANRDLFGSRISSPSVLFPEAASVGSIDLFFLRSQFPSYLPLSIPIDKFSPIIFSALESGHLPFLEYLATLPYHSEEPWLLPSTTLFRQVLAKRAAKSGDGNVIKFLNSQYPMEKQFVLDYASILTRDGQTAQVSGALEAGHVDLARALLSQITFKNFDVATVRRI